MKQKQLWLALFLLAGILMLAIFSEQLAPFDPLEADMNHSLNAPNNIHKFGTDKLGRDLLSRVIYGTRASLGSTLIMVTVVFILGTTLGILAGFFGGWIDQILMRLADMLISFPGLVLAIAIAGVLGPNLTNAVIAITAVSWTKYARLSRSLVLKIKQSLYMNAAVVTGVGKVRRMTHYILPNIFPPMLTTAMADVGTLMLEIASLSFLGFGAQAPIPEWGLMLNEGRTYLAAAPWLMFYPGVAVILVVITFNLLGDSLSDLLDTN